MIATRPTFVGKLAGIGTLVMLAAIIFAISLSWVSDTYLRGATTIQRLEVQERQLLMRRRDTAELEELRTALEEANPEDFGVVEAATLDVARADMQQTLRAIAADIGAGILDMRSNATEAPEAVALGIRMTLPDDQLAPLLIRLQNARTAIFLESLAISARPARPEQPLHLDVEMVVLSYVSVAQASEVDK